MTTPSCPTSTSVDNMKRIFALMALAVLGACNNEIDQSTRPENIVGTYHLVTWGGRALPTTIRSDSVVQQVLDGELILASDRAWSEAISIKTTFKGNSRVEAVTSFGSWNNIRPSAFISFNDKANLYQFTGTAAGGTIVLNTVAGDELVYTR